MFILMILVAFVTRTEAFVPFQFPTHRQFSSLVLHNAETTTTIKTNGNFDKLEIEEVNSSESNSNEIRPLHQNWWPVSCTFALDKSRPNPIELLNQKLVLFWSESDDEWKCLDDRCSHRFAPLSEGRIIENNCLQCAYHGWEFDGQGKCQKVPQTTTGSGGRSIAAYPVRVQCGMVFVWADPASYQELGKSISIPTFPLLEEKTENGGESICFMRDLPYGYELLGENLLDLSHLPFSHHGVGSLNRDLGGPLPFRMLSASQKSDDNPMFEVILDEASKTDPTFKSIPNTPSTATLNLGFYDPCHVRYTRQYTPGHASGTSYVALYFCPTSSTQSRVFLFNLFPKPQPPPKKSFSQRIKSWVNPADIKRRVSVRSLMQKLPPYAGHMLMHQIFDGDGIFLHIQGDRMQRANLTYKDYDTPSSADVMVNAFRRYNNAACKATRSLGLDDLADAVVPPSGYSDKLPRSKMLDRYESHTKHCKICLTAMKEAQSKKKRLEILETALIGATGASSMALVGTLFFGFLSPAVIPSALIRFFAGTTASCIGGCVSISKRKPKLEKEIQQFIYEDYVHAEKN